MSLQVSSGFIDVLAWPLSAAEKHLQECNCQYVCQEIKAPRQAEATADSVWYVAGQSLSEDGIYRLLVCSKKRKEVQ